MKSCNVQRSQITGLTIRYIRQRNPLQCVPIALLNYWKWRGDNVTYRDLGWAVQLCGCEARLGTLCKKVSGVLGKRARRATWDQVKRALSAGKIIFVEEYRPDIDAKHSWLIVGLLTGSTGILAVNADCDSTYTVLSYQAVVALLQHSRVWFLERGRV